MKYIRTIHLLAALLLLVAATAEAQYEREEHHEFPLAPDGRVSIDSYQGSIRIDTWDKPLVRVHIRTQSNGAYDGAQEDVKKTHIRISSEPRTLRLKTESSGTSGISSIVSLFTGRSSRQPLVHYHITMPNTASIAIDDYKSDIDVRNILSHVSIDTYKGRMNIADVSGHIHIDTYKGAFRVRRLTGGMDVDTYKGSGEIQFKSFLHASSLTSYKGTITLTIPANTGFNLHADLNRRGALDSDIHFRHARSDEFSGRVNGGGPVLSLETVRGKFAIRKR